MSKSIITTHLNCFHAADDIDSHGHADAPFLTESNSRTKICKQNIDFVIDVGLGAPGSTKQFYNIGAYVSVSMQQLFKKDFGVIIDRMSKMIYTESENIQDYIKTSEIIDYDHRLIIEKCLELEKGTEDEISLIKKIYEFVRDDIHHSGDIGEQRVTCTASEVLEYGHGICCAKSHLLAAILRFFGIPTGFCYQKLCSNQEDLALGIVDKKVLHGLNAVYLKDLNKWRLDARGNKPGVDAQFCIDEEKIAWPVNKELGEKDNPIIFKEPNKTVVEILRKSSNRKELWMQWECGLKDLFRT